MTNVTLLLVGALPCFASPVYPHPLPLIVSHSHPGGLLEPDDTLLYTHELSSSQDVSSESIELSVTSCKHCQISTGLIIILDTVSLYNHLADDAVEEIHIRCNLYHTVSGCER